MPSVRTDQNGIIVNEQSASQPQGIPTSTDTRAHVCEFGRVLTQGSHDDKKGSEESELEIDLRT